MDSLNATERGGLQAWWNPEIHVLDLFEETNVAVRPERSLLKNSSIYNLDCS